RPSDAARGEDDRFCLKQTKTAALAVVGKSAGDAVTVLEEGDDRDLHEDVDALMDAVILQRANQLEAGAVADVRQTRIPVAAEVALQNAAVGGAIEHCAPRLELLHAIGRFLRVQLGHAPVVDVLPAAHGVGEVHAPVVAIVDVAHRRGHAALGHHGVRFAEQRFADETDLDAVRRRFDRRAQAGAARADDEYVVFSSLIFYKTHYCGIPSGGA